jgi:hypothetical protein
MGKPIDVLGWLGTENGYTQDLRSNPTLVHGVTCPKVRHVRGGELHSEDDDTPYDVDGCRYCGRCHYAL